MLLCVHVCEQESQSKKSLRCAQQAYTLLFADVTTPGSAGAKKAAESPGYYAQLLVRLCACAIVDSHACSTQHADCIHHSVVRCSGT
jgi:hypothetical protein